MVTAADVKKIAPNLATMPDLTLDCFIAIAVKQVDPVCWTDLVNEGITFLAAHLATDSKKSGASGAVSSKEVGDIKIAYSSSSGLGDDYGSTSYGITFNTMMKSRCFGLKVYSDC